MALVTLMDAWGEATKRAGEQRQMAAEAKAAGLSQSLNTQAHTAMCRAAEDEFDRIPDRLAPRQALVNLALGMVEECEVDLIPSRRSPWPRTSIWRRSR